MIYLIIDASTLNLRKQIWLVLFKFSRYNFDENVKWRQLASVSFTEVRESTVRNGALSWWSFCLYTQHQGAVKIAHKERQNMKT